MAAPEADRVVAVCSNCKERPRTGEQRWCKVCRAAYMRAHRAANAAGQAEHVSPGRKWTGVYFIASGGFVKIGISMDVVRRSYAIQSANPEVITPLGFIQQPTLLDALQLEGELHQRFWRAFHRGEWFRDDVSIRDFIAANARPWPMLWVEVDQMTMEPLGVSRGA